MALLCVWQAVDAGTNVRIVLLGVGTTRQAGGGRLYRRQPSRRGGMALTDRIICGYQPSRLGSNPARWPRGTTIRYRVALTGLPGIDRDLFRRVFRSACDSWQAVCGIEFAEVD